MKHYLPKHILILYAEEVYTLWLLALRMILDFQLQRTSYMQHFVYRNLASWRCFKFVSPYQQWTRILSKRINILWTSKKKCVRGICIALWNTISTKDVKWWTVIVINFVVSYLTERQDQVQSLPSNVVVLEMMLFLI